MGYYTKYDITMYPRMNDEDELKVMREIASKIYNEDPTTISDDEAKWCFDEHMKWYNHVNDMLDISKKFPNITFVLEGEGEENGDLWVKYFNNGEVEECFAEIVYPQPKNPKFQYMM